MTSSAPPAGVSKRERLARLLGNRTSSVLLRQFFRAPGFVCITHHRVADRVAHDPDVISAAPAQLASQAAWVRDAGFEALTGSAIADVLSGQRRLDAPAVAFTFDDGYDDNFAAGRMLMERFGVPATFFIPTAFIESGLIPPWDRLGYAAQHAGGPVLDLPRIDGHGPWSFSLGDYGVAISALMQVFSTLPAALKIPFVEACERSAGARASDGAPSPFMSWNQIRALRDMGHTIGAHTHTHPVLASLSPEEQHEEMRLSKTILERQLGSPVDLFAYPYGKPGRSFSAQTKEIAARVGFKAAFSFYGGWNRPGGIDPFDVKRIKVDPGTSMPMFRTRVISRGRIPV